MYQLIMVRVTEIYCWMKWFAQDTRHLSGIANIWAGTTITACIKRMWELIVFRRVFDYISNKFAKILIFLIMYSEKKTSNGKRRHIFTKLQFTARKPTFQFLLKCDFQRPFSD